MMILSFDSSRTQAQQLADQLGLPHQPVEVHHFPDGESRVKVPSPLPQKVIFCVSLHNPNQKLIELLLAIAASRKQGCREAYLVAPYLCYMRQDIEFEPGQAVSQLIIGELLSSRIEGIITVDPHLHRINDLSESFIHCKTTSLLAAGVIGAFLEKDNRNSDNARILVGPDAESEQWVKAAADTSGLPYCVASKERFGDRDVKVSLPKVDFQGKHAIILDDVISSGHTIQQAALALTEAGCSQVDAACTHALFAPGATAALQQAGVSKIISCNSIPHETNCIDLSPLLAEAVSKMAG
ncbi:MAG: phosphoribosylpyrophosphate synthetase [Pseudomonadales bacterium]|nr:phosphoribosylpyrophosphate synthetase [Pseudomonadales bacterium]